MTTVRAIAEDKYNELEELVVAYIGQARDKREATILAAKAEEILEGANTVGEVKEAFENLLSYLRTNT